MTITVIRNTGGKSTGKDPSFNNRTSSTILSYLLEVTSNYLDKSVLSALESESGVEGE